MIIGVWGKRRKGQFLGDRVYIFIVNKDGQLLSSIQVIVIHRRMQAV